MHVWVLCSFSFGYVLSWLTNGYLWMLFDGFLYEIAGYFAKIKIQWEDERVFILKSQIVIEIFRFPCTKSLKITLHPLSHTPLTYFSCNTILIISTIKLFVALTVLLIYLTTTHTTNFFFDSSLNFILLLLAYSDHKK
jgi:hypothetical protein